MRKDSRYVQGIFTPKNPKKCLSRQNVYRSSLELQMFRYLDRSSNVVLWASEKCVVPYVAPDGRTRRYFVDLMAHVKDKEGNIKKLLIEVKPERQTKPPTISNKKSPKTMMYENYTYAVNLAKWEAAREYATRRGYTFVIFNEKHIKE